MATKKQGKGPSIDNNGSEKEGSVVKNKVPFSTVESYDDIDMNYYGPDDLDVLEDIEKIFFIFDIASESPNGFMDLEEYKKYYILLEKGYRLVEYQKRRLSNAHFFCQQRHAQVVAAAIDLAQKSLKAKEGEISFEEYIRGEQR